MPRVRVPEDDAARDLPRLERLEDQLIVPRATAVHLTHLYSTLGPLAWMDEGPEICTRSLSTCETSQPYRLITLYRP